MTASKIERVSHDRLRSTDYNNTYKKLEVQYSADSFVVADSFVLRNNIYGKNRQLLVAA